MVISQFVFFFFSSRRRHTRLQGDWSSDVCSSDLNSCHTKSYETCWSASDHAVARGATFCRLLANPSPLRRYEWRWLLPWFESDLGGQHALRHHHQRREGRQWNFVQAEHQWLGLH